MANLNPEQAKHETVMDVTQEQIARVYAQAFLGAAEGAPNLDGLVEELASVVNEVLNRFPQLERTLETSLVSQEKKEQLLDRIFSGKASKEVLNFLKVLSRHGRLGLLRLVARLVSKLHATLCGKIDVEFCTAAPVDDALRNEVVAQLRKSLSAEPVLSVRVDPALIAGMVIRVGDRVYDGSVATQLEHTRRAMIQKATEQIDSSPEKFFTAVG